MTTNQERAALFQKNRSRMLEQQNEREEKLLAPKKPATRGYYQRVGDRHSAVLVDGSIVYGTLQSSGNVGKGDTVCITRDSLTGTVMIDVINR